MNEQYAKLINQIPSIMQDPSKSFAENAIDVVGSSHYIYIATPFTADKHLDIMRARAFVARAVGAELSKNGLLYWNPIADLTTDTDPQADPIDNSKNWYEIDLSALATCTHMFIINAPGILESIGVALEIGFAKGRQISTYTIPKDVWKPLVSATTRDIIHVNKHKET